MVEAVSLCAGDRRHAVQASTLKQLSEASPIKEKASLHRQLAALQEDLQAKQAQIVAQRKDVNYRQHLLQYAAGLLFLYPISKSLILLPFLHSAVVFMLAALLEALCEWSFTEDVCCRRCSARSA